MAGWRLLVEDGVSAAEGLATDEALATRVGVGVSPPTLRLYTYRAHCALIGRFQDPQRELDLPYCRRHAVQVNRRPTGGGAILMGPDQLGVALCLSRHSVKGRARALMGWFGEGLLAALGELGLRGEFRGKNDLAVGGRKIAGLGLHRTASGGLLLHASLLVDLDLPLMTRVLRSPFEEDGPPPITTVREQLDAPITLGDVRGRVAASFDAPEVAGSLDDEEQAAVSELIRTRYEQESWLRSRQRAGTSLGESRIRTSGGTLTCQLALAGVAIQAARITGDFFADERLTDELEARLRWHSTAPAALAETVRAVWSGFAPEDGTLTLESLTRVVLDAAPAPYGCFVNPERSDD